MMDSLRSATRNTGFERWLDATLRPRDSASSVQEESPKAPRTDADSPKAAAGSDAGSSGHGSDAALAEVAQYLAGSTPRQGQGAASVFRPGWEDIFRMNQKTLEVRRSHKFAVQCIGYLSL